MNFNQEQSTISPDFAAGPTTAKPAQSSGSNSNSPSKATKIENPFDIYINASTASSSAGVNKSVYSGSAPYAHIQQHQQNDGKSDKSWIALMNDDKAALDVFQLLPTTQTAAINKLDDKTTDAPGTYPLPNTAAAVTDDSNNLQLQNTASLLFETTRSSDTLGFDPETYSYDEEMGAIYAESIKKSSTSTRHQNILHKLSEEEDSTHVADESYKNDSSNNPPIIAMTSLMASTSHPSSLLQDIVTTPAFPPTKPVTRIRPQTSEQPKEMAPPPTDIPYLQDPRNYDYSDVAIQSNHQPYIPSSATFDSNVSSIGDIDPQFTTSSDIVRQHVDNNTSTNRNAKMVSLGTGSIVIVETASSSEQTTSNNHDANGDMNDEEEDNQLAARIMFVLQGAAALNSGKAIVGVKNSGTDQEHQYIPSDQPHTSMTDSQIYVTESEENQKRESTDGTYDEDIDNLPPATIVVPSASSISSPLSQQQQERQHIVLEPFSYASSTDDGDNEVIKGFFGDTDTEDDEPSLLSNLSPNQRLQSYGPIDIPANSNNDTVSQFSGQSQRNIVQNASTDVSTLDSASYNNSWSNVTPALAMTTAGLGVQTYDNIKILQHPPSSPPLSPQGIEDVHHKMSHQSSPDGADDVKYKMSLMHQRFDSSKSVGKEKGHFPRQDDNKHDEAKIVDAQAEDKSRNNRYWCAIYVGFIFLFVGIVLLIYFLVRNNKDTPMESPSPPLYPPSTKVPKSPTLSPSLAPFATLPPILLVRDELFLQLQNVSSDNGTTIATPDTPQALAFDWLLSDPKISDYSISRRLTRFALAVFYYSTGGNSSDINVTANSLNSTITQPSALWLDSYLWLSFEDECLWYTRSRSGLCGISNDTQLTVVQNLDVSYNNLLGTIPPEIGLLSNLQILSIGGGPDTSLTGTIPSELGNLSLLQELRLEYNQLTGRVPASIGRCTFLQSIDLSNNHLRGLIPSDIGMMTNLVILSLDHNAFQGPIPTTIGQCSSIKTLNLAHNDLALLPKEVYRLSNLVFLDVQNNTLSGPFESPNKIGGLRNINTILLSRNQLSGSLPIDFNVLSTLKVLDLSYNSFTGTIPELFVRNNVTNATFNDDSLPSDGNIFTSNNRSIGLDLLRILHLNNNLLTGNVPESFSELSNLQVLSLHSNLFNGTVPTTVCDTFNITRATVSIDCLEVKCSCCIFCCNMNNGTTSDPVVSDPQPQFGQQPDDGDDVCVCRHWNTTLEWLCY